MPPILPSALIFALFSSAVYTLTPPHSIDCASHCAFPSRSQPPLTHPTCAPGTLDGAYFFLQPLGHGSASSVIKATFVPYHKRSVHCLPPSQPQPPPFHPPSISSPHPTHNPSSQHKSPIEENETHAHAVAIKIFDRIPAGENTTAHALAISQEWDNVRRFSAREGFVRGIELRHERERYLLAMQLCEVSLADVLGQRVMGSREVWRVWKRVVGSVWVLHGSGFAHRDLKAENVLFCGGDGEPRLGDLGSMVRVVGEDGIVRLVRDIDGTPPYIAPEVWGPNPHNPAVADVWQLGILFVAMTLRMFPWQQAMASDEDFAHFLEFRDELFNELPQYARTVVSGMLEVDPRKRIGWKAIVNQIFHEGLT